MYYSISVIKGRKKEKERYLGVLNTLAPWNNAAWMGFVEMGLASSVFA